MTETGVPEQALHRWKGQGRVDAGLAEGTASTQSYALRTRINFQHLYPPVKTQAIMKGLLLFAVLFFAGVLVAAVTRKSNWAVLMVVMIGTPVHSARNLGSSYHQGLGVLILVMGVALAMVLPVTQRPRLVSFAIGVFCGLLFVTYQVTAYLFPALLGAAIFGPTSRHSIVRKQRATRTVYRSYIRCGAAFAAAFLGIMGSRPAMARLMGVDLDNSIVYALEMRDAGDNFGPEIGGDTLAVSMLPEGFLTAMAVSWAACVILIFANKNLISKQVWT